jgi:exodeoxyribonuclease VII large subunit
VARGGGSPEDLWPFNEEIVARAIFASAIPVISWVGHESDWSISDLVSDLRASTPTAAAEQAVPNITELMGRLDYYVSQMHLYCSTKIDTGRNELKYSVAKLDRALPDLVTYKIRLDDLITRANSNIVHKNDLTKEYLKGLAEKMTALAPHTTIARGYSVLQKSLDGKIVNSVDDIGSGENISITVSDGVIDAKTVEDNMGLGVPEEHQLNLL